MSDLGALTAVKDKTNESDVGGQYHSCSILKKKNKKNKQLSPEIMGQAPGLGTKF